MLRSNHSTADARRQLSIPMAATDNDPAGLSRRRFLQTVAYGGIGGAVLGTADAAFGGGLLPGERRDAWAAPPIADNEGILINIVMFGGNDGLNTLVPYTNGDYYTMREGLASRRTRCWRSTARLGCIPILAS